MTTTLHNLRREPQAIAARLEIMQTLAAKYKFAQWLARVMHVRGSLLVEQGQGEEGIALMHQGLTAWQATGAVIGRTHQLTNLAKAYGSVGQTEPGRHIVSEALALMDQTGERFCAAELYRLKGELLLQQEATTETTRQTWQAAEACFHTALAVARQQQARGWELRAAMSLSRLWQQQGKCVDAYDLLAPIYGWFTEGFDTADLQDAKVLLEDLRTYNSRSQNPGVL